jgi:uncharacterized membrane protein YccC
MTVATRHSLADPQRPSWPQRQLGRLRTWTSTATGARPPLLFGLRLWASVCLALYIAFWMQLDNAFWAGTSAAIVCQPHLGASLRKGWYRMVGTVVGAVAIVVLTAFFPQERAAFLGSLALWGAACALLATLLRNFAAYAAALAGYTAAIVAYDQLGATGGPNGQAFMLAITRVTEISIGIVSAGIVLAGTDLGGARRRLATLLATPSVEIASRFVEMLADPRPDFSETRRVRRELARRVIELDPAIDEALGESSRLRYHSPVLKTAVDDLLAALAGWRTVAVHLAGLPDRDTRLAADAILRNLPPALRSTGHSPPERWIADPIRWRGTCESAARTLRALPATTPSLRLLTDESARVLAGIAGALDGLALLVVDPDRPRSRGRKRRLSVPDWLPSLVNALRAFLTIGAVALFWIATSWPHGALAMTWSAIAVILFSPRADQSYTFVIGFTLGNLIAAVFAAIVAFAVLPRVATFEGFCAVIALYLIPAGALLAQHPQKAAFVAMAANFVPLLAPANRMTYDTQQFYNTALAIIAGCGAAALAFRLLPHPSPAMRTRRLLALTLRDLGRLATGPVPAAPERWEHRIYGRLAVLPDEAEPQQRSDLLAALALGRQIIAVRGAAPILRVESDVDAALAALAEGRSANALARLHRLEESLAVRTGARAETSFALRIRSSILAMREIFMDHARYLDGMPA